MRCVQDLRAGRARECKAGVLRLLARFPRDQALLRLAVECLGTLDEVHAALHHALASLRLAPDDAGMLMNAGRLHARLGQIDPALDALDRAGTLGLLPAATEAVELRLGAGRFVEALDTLDALIARHEGNPNGPHDSLARGSCELLRAQALLALGDCRACVRTLRELSTEHAAPALAMPATALLASALNYMPEASPEEVFAAHLRFGALLDACPLHADWRHIPPDPDRVLRVALVSPDLRTHSVACFAEPLLRHLPTHAMQVFAYYLASAQDATTARLRSLAHAWRHLPHQGPADVARALREDRIDVAIDLAGLTSTVGVGALAHGAAPVCATYLGYPNTTGSRRVHTRIVDALTDPPAQGTANPLATEHLVRLDRCFLSYGPPEDAPAPTPRDPSAPTTFASFNAVQKINPVVAGVWRRTLDRVPASRLLIKANGLREARALSMLSERLAAWGLPPDRVDVAPTTPTRAEHLAMYARVDVALDTFPYHGTTTTCEALWMGVPVVSLAGHAHASRVGVSLLSSVGLAGLIAGSQDELVDIASKLALDRARLAHLRSTLRDTMRASPLCDAPSHAHAFAGALRERWRAWCAASTDPARHATNDSPA